VSSLECRPPLAPPEAALAPVTVVVPTYNESENFPLLFARIQFALEEEGRPFEVLVVDDNSPDGTADVAQRLDARVRSFVRQERGLATAVIFGLQHATHDLCVCIDGDLSHPPEKIPELLGHLERGAPFAIGSRYVAGGETVDWSPLRWLNSWGATLLARPLTKVHDPMSGFFACRRSEVPFAELNPIGYKIGLEILVKSSISAPAEVPITFTDRLHGRSKMTAKEQLAYLTHLFRLYRWKWPIPVALVLFCLVGATGMIVDLTVLTALVEIGGLWFGWARIAGFAAAVSVNFALNDNITFRHKGKPGLLNRYLRFVFTSTAGLTVNYATSLALFSRVAWFETHYGVAAILGVLAGTLVNFTGARWFAFRRTE